MLTFLRAVAIFFLLSLGSALAVAPAITAVKVTDIAGGAAKLNAKVTANGLATVVTFSYRDAATTDAFTEVVVVPDVAAAEVSKDVEVTVTGLTSGQTYEFKVKAVQTGGDTTAPADAFVFVQTTDSPTLTIDERPTHSGTNTATVHGTVTTAGVAGEIFFEYGPTTAYEIGQIGNLAVAANATASIDTALTPVTAVPATDTTYHYRFVFEAALPSTIRVNTPDDVNNVGPKAVADSAEITAIEAVTIEVLDNDTDPENDVRTILSFTNPARGTVVNNGTDLTYTPGATFRDGDRFSYTIYDVFGARATATVTIRSLRSSLAGTHGGLLIKANGREIGYLTLVTNARGSFTGIAKIKGERYVLVGTLTADGSFDGFAVGKEGLLPVQISTTNGENGAVVTAVFGNGQFTADLNVSDTEATTRSELAQRYTAGIAAGGSGPVNGSDPGSPPSGAGWLIARARDDGTAQIKGRLSDARAFSTRGTVNLVDGVARLNFYDDLADTRLVGDLTLGETVGGTVHTDRDGSSNDLLRRAYDLTQTISGARYLPPARDKPVLRTQTSRGQDLTISFEGGSLGGTLTRNLHLDDRDRVKVLNSSAEELKVKIDRKSGRFQAKVTIDTEGTRIKATGVLIQATGGGAGGRGTGTFRTVDGAGTVTIGLGTSSGTPTPTPLPTPTPVPVVPVEPDPAVP